MSETSKRVLICGLHEDWHQLVKNTFKGYFFDYLKNPDEFANFLNMEGATFYPVVFAGETSGVVPQEMAQAFRMQYPDSKVFYISASRENFNRAFLIKNGFSDAFLMPLDTVIMTKRIEELYAFLEAGDGKVLKPVKVIDMQPNDQMNFDVSVYLPSSKRHVKFAASGESLDQDRVDRLSKFKVNNMYVDARDMKLFYQYTAERLRALGKNAAMGETEKVERLENAMRELFVGIFQTADQESSLQEGREMMESSKQIVDSYIMQAGEPKDWYKNVVNVVGAGERNLYSHNSRVSTLAALFSIALQKGNAEDMAVAGLFHDLGMGELPPDLQNKSYEKMTPDEKNLYHIHPSVSVKLLKMKKIVVPAIVYEAIEQHHETFNGKGFPKGMVPPKLKVESQILAMADRFDELTSPDTSDGQEALKPLEAIKAMEASNHYDPTLLGKLRVLFEKSEN
jgi:HD-GYP domain-containing protein (c-di-GMP phosphodiesterase class II)